jgi:GDP-L-fucose synthase
MNKKTIITGGHGFLGTHLVNKFLDKGYSKKDLFIPSSKDYDLRKLKDIKKLLSDFKADTIIHLAANVGGIGYNQKYPGTLFYDNAIMGIQLIEEARKAGIKKFVNIGTICAYPKFTPVPFKEENLWDGYPEETNAPYGLAKKMGLVQGQAYRQQYGFNAIYLLPVNLYGPGDNFDPKSSHVIPALIKKIHDAKKSRKKQITVWGTGKASREFLFVSDAAEAIYLASEKYNKPAPVNLGSGMEITIKELVELLVNLMDFEGEIKWDTSKPDGQPRRSLDVNRAKEEFGFKAQTDFKTGLKETIEWYTNQA